MSDLPFLQPDRELYYNLGLLTLVIGKLGKTKRNKLVLNIDKLQTFYFLVTRPVILNKVLSLTNKKLINIDEKEYFNVDSISANLDKLYDRKKIKLLLRLLAIKGAVSVTYSEKDGLLFELSEVGEQMLEHLNFGYFKQASSFVERLIALQSEAPSKLNSYINAALNQG